MSENSHVDRSLVVKERDGPNDSAWVSDEVCARIDVYVGDSILVEGRRETVAELRGVTEGASTEVFLSEDVRENADVSVDDYVSVGRVEGAVPRAKMVIVHPVSPDTCEEVDAGELRIKAALENRLVAFGDTVTTGLDSPEEVEVARKVPARGPVEIGVDTVVRLRDRPNTPAMKLLLEGSRRGFERSVDRRQRIVTDLNQAIRINVLIASIVVTGVLAATDISLADYLTNAFLLLGSVVWVGSTGGAFVLNRHIGGKRIIGPDTSDLWSVLYRGAAESDTAYFLLESYDYWADRNIEANLEFVRKIWYTRVGTFVTIVSLGVGLFIELR